MCVCCKSCEYPPLLSWAIYICSAVLTEAIAGINEPKPEKKDASILASNIAVKGGTTEAGLREFKNKKILHKIFKKVVFAAYKRANQLGK